MLLLYPLFLSLKHHHMSENPTDLTRIRRLPQRGRYDKASLYAVLDAGYLCHVAFAVKGRPVVLPTAYVRVQDEVIVHGAAANAMLHQLLDQQQACLSVSHLDGLVLARSVFNHSFNYRSAVVFGRPRQISAEQEKRQALQAFTEHIVPGRWQEARQPTAAELKATLVVAVAIEEFSVKIREGAPADSPADYELPVWAGVVPLSQQYGTPLPDPQLAGEELLPPSVENLIKQ